MIVLHVESVPNYMKAAELISKMRKPKFDVYCRSLSGDLLAFARRISSYTLNYQAGSDPESIVDEIKRTSWEVVVTFINGYYGSPLLR